MKIKRISGSVIYFFGRVIPSARLRLLVGSWLLTAGLMSCSTTTNSGSAEPDKTGNDSVRAKCYDPAIPVNDSSVTKQDTAAIEQDTIPIKMCYRPTLQQSIEHNKDQNE